MEYFLTNLLWVYAKTASTGHYYLITSETRNTVVSLLMNDEYIARRTILMIRYFHRRIVIYHLVDVVLNYSTRQHATQEKDVIIIPSSSLTFT